MPWCYKNVRFIAFLLQLDMGYKHLREHEIFQLVTLHFHCVLAALVREIGDDEGEAQLQGVRNMWEMAAVFEFLDVFNAQLALNLSFTGDALEEAFVRSPGPGLLADLHMVSC